jgi:hypothetical protein
MIKHFYGKSSYLPLNEDLYNLNIFISAKKLQYLLRIIMTKFEDKTYLRKEQTENNN